jgi:DNA repair protein RadC
MQLETCSHARHARMHGNSGLAQRRTTAREAARQGRRGAVRRGVAGHLAAHGNAGALGTRSCAQFHSLRKLIAADRQRFCAERGLGLARFAELQAAVEIARRQLSETLRAGPSLASPRATRDFLASQLRDLEHEVFCCLYLDKRHRLIQYQELFRGTIDGASVHPREIVKLALQRNSAAVIIAHNHPSGVPEPSQADELITQRVKEALGLVDIRLLDHIIIGDGASVSLAERGLV